MPRILFAGLRRMYVALFFFAALWLISPAHAEYVWLQPHAPASLQARFGLPGNVQSPVGLVAPRAYLAGGADLLMTVMDDAFSIAVPAPGDVRLVASRDDGNGILTYYQARHGRSETRARNDLELVPTTPGGNTFRLMWKGSAIAAVRVNVETSAGWRRTLTPGKDGTVTLSTPFPGLYVLEVTAKINGAVSLNGKQYQDVRHTATLSFEVDD